jgi:hypothetical protein
MQKMNYQVTDNDVSSMKFFFEHRDDTLDIVEPLKRAYQNRYSEYVIGSGNIYNVGNGYSDNILPPDHFGYNVNKTFGDNYNGVVYFLEYPPARDYWQKVYPNYPSLWRFTSTDYQLMQEDFSVSRFYGNGNINIYIINTDKL